LHVVKKSRGFFKVTEGIIQNIYFTPPTLLGKYAVIDKYSHLKKKKELLNNYAIMQKMRSF